MQKRTYVVPHHELGEIQRVHVQDLNLGVFASLTEEYLRTDDSTQETSRELDVTLVEGPAGEWQIVHDSQVLGVVGAEAKARYEELAWLLETGLNPRVTAEASLGDQPAVELLLPAPGLCLPQNNPPASSWVMLNEGPTIVLDKLPSGLDSHTPAHVLITLRRGSDSISAYLGQQLVGILPSSRYRVLDATLADCSERGLIAVTRGFINEGTLRITPGDTPTVLPPKPIIPRQGIIRPQHEPSRQPAENAAAADKAAAVKNAKRGILLTATTAAVGILIAGMVGFACNKTFFPQDSAPVNFSTSYSEDMEPSADPSTESPHSPSGYVIYRDLTEYRQAVGDTPAAGTPAADTSAAGDSAPSESAPSTTMVSR